MPQNLSLDYDENVRLLDKLLKVGESFDLVTRNLKFASKRARLYMLDGFVKDAVLFKIMSPIMALTPEKITTCTDSQDFVDRYLPYMEVECEGDAEKLAAQVLAGPVALLIEGFPTAVLIDSRTYPTRSLSEPESDRALRGARDSFSETLVINTALIRRHVRDSRLIMKYFSVGTVSKTDVVVCYFEERADQKILDTLFSKLSALKVKSLSMGQESLAEALIPNGWWNPFPKVRYSERPDTAAATASEGGILLIVDGTPSVMLLPTGFLDFFQDTNDYYFPPVVGTYMRTVRFIIFLLTLFLIPGWFLLIRNPQWIPWWLDFIKINKMNEVPVFFQLLLVELIIDCLKQASLNTPSALGASFSVVSGLILGEFAVTARWFAPEVLLYMAFVSVATFAQPSFELGYAVKLSRIILIVAVAFFDLWGFIGGNILILFMIITTPTITGQNYLYPLFPFNGKKLMRLLFRRRMSAENS